MGFAQDTLDRLRTTREVRIETRSASGTVHHTIIWVVVDQDRAYIRTYLGPRSRWYREALAAGECTLWVGKDPVYVRVTPATDPDQVAAVSRELETKYAHSSSTSAMVRDEVLETTLELLPH